MYYVCILKAYSLKIKYCIFQLPFSNAVNLLSNVPVSCLDVLICPLTHEETAQEAATLDELPSDKTPEKDPALKSSTMVYNGMNMEAIHVLLSFMEKRIDKVRLWRGEAPAPPCPAERRAAWALSLSFVLGMVYVLLLRELYQDNDKLEETEGICVKLKLYFYTKFITSVWK